VVGPQTRPFHTRDGTDVLQFDQGLRGQGQIYAWEGETGQRACYVYGPLWEYYDGIGGVASGMGRPVRDQRTITDGRGRARGQLLQLEHGIIAWSEGNGTWQVRDRMYLEFQRRGGLSRLGFPRGNASGDGTRQEFERGTIDLRSNGGQPRPSSPAA
jgi:uncharacterized protein with LGFP repeats